MAPSDDSGDRDLAHQVGVALKALRGTETRSEAARRLGIPRPNLIELEEGIANPTLARLQRVVAGYGARLHVSTVADADR